MDEIAALLGKSDQNLVWIACEMSGLEPNKERLLEIAVIVTDPHLALRIEGPVLVIHQSDALLAQMDAWNKGTHGKSGLIDKVKAAEEQSAQLTIVGGVLRHELLLLSDEVLIAKVAGSLRIVGVD